MIKSETKKINPANLKPAPWRATYVLKPDLKLLASSISEYGLIAPIIVQKQSKYIIDGYHRLLAISSTKELVKRFSEGVPCLEFDIDDIDSMIMHIQINRARGTIVAKHISKSKIHYKRNR